LKRRFCQFFRRQSKKHLMKLFPAEIISIISLELEDLSDLISFSQSSRCTYFFLKSSRSLRLKWFVLHGQHQFFAIKTANLLKVPISPEFIDQHLYSFFPIYHHISPKIMAETSASRQQLFTAGSTDCSTEIKVFTHFCWTHAIPHYILNNLLCGNHFFDLDQWLHNLINRKIGHPNNSVHLQNFTRVFELLTGDRNKNVMRKLEKCLDFIGVSLDVHHSSFKCASSQQRIGWERVDCKLGEDQQ
jgi:hypothetical protein